jgi:hypothetical protein
MSFSRGKSRLSQAQSEIPQNSKLGWLEGDTFIQYKTPKSALSKKYISENPTNYINTPELKTVSEISTPSHENSYSASAATRNLSLKKSKIIKKVLI